MNRSTRRISVRCIAALAALSSAVLASCSAGDTGGANLEEGISSAFTLRVSASANRTSSALLQGANLNGLEYVFTSDSTGTPQPSGIKQVSYWLDDTTMSGTPTHVEQQSPYDFVGTTSSGTAYPWDVTKLTAGTHTITQSVVLLAANGGAPQKYVATFTIGAKDAGTDSGGVADTGDGGADSTIDAAQGDSGHQTVIFSQPSYTAIAGHFFAPLCTTGLGAGPIPQGNRYTFNVVSWQCPINTGFVTDASSASSLTGFNPNRGMSLGTYQVGYANAPGASVAQMDGSQVGVYMDSDDLAGYATCPSQGCKMMMTPEVKFPVAQYKPFATGNAVVVSFELQVQTAERNNGSEGYATSDLLFQDTSGAIDANTNGPYQFSCGEVIFNGGSPTASCNTAVDPVTGNIMVNCPMLRGSPYSNNFTLLPGSNAFQHTTWTAMLPFAYSISSAQFKNALAAAKAAYPTATFSTNPADYSLIEHHANFELNKYDLGRARLGYSMKGITIALQ